MLIMGAACSTCFCPMGVYGKKLIVIDSDIKVHRVIRDRRHDPRPSVPGQASLAPCHPLTASGNYVALLPLEHLPVIQYWLSSNIIASLMIVSGLVD